MFSIIVPLFLQHKLIIFLFESFFAFFLFKERRWGLGGFAPRQVWDWGCAAVGGGTPNPLLAPLQREFYCVLIAYQTADSEEYPRGSSAYICAYNASTFCYRQRVPKAFGRTAIRRSFPLYRCISFLKKYRQGYNEKGVTSDTSLSPSSYHLLRHNAISIIYP